MRRTKNISNTPNTLPYITTHNPRNTETYNIIYQNIPLLRQDPRMKKALETHKIIKSKRQPKSLKKLLTSAKLPTENTTPIVKKCGRPNCGTCINLLEGTSYIFNSPSGLRKYLYYFTRVISRWLKLSNSGHLCLTNKV